MISIDYLRQSAAEVGFSLDDAMLLQFDKYAKTLVEWNKNINLTAIIEPKDIVIKHFVDSLLLLNHIDSPTARIIDVGTGAGFPSLPCKIVGKNLDVTLLDSLNKRINFLNAVCEDVGIAAKAVHGRAEEMGCDAVYREKFDVATARAVAHLCDLAEYCLPFVKVGGYFIALKGYEIENELEEAMHAIKALGGEVDTVAKYELQDGNRRAIICIKKMSATPKKYPRNRAQMTKHSMKVVADEDCE